MQRVAKLVSKNAFTIWLLIRKPSSAWLEFSDSASERFKTITEWCKIEKDLLPIKHKALEKLDSERFTSLFETYNGIIFDKERLSFVDLTDEFYEESPQLVIHIDDVIDDDIRIDVELIAENLFTENEWKELREIGATSKIFEIEERFLA